MSCYIKTSVWFCIYYIRYMFFSNVGLFWDAFRIRNYPKYGEEMIRKVFKRETKWRLK